MARSKRYLNETFTEVQLETIKSLEEKIDEELLQEWTGSGEEILVYLDSSYIPKIQAELIRRYHNADEDWEIYFGVSEGRSFISFS